MCYKFPAAYLPRIREIDVRVLAPRESWKAASAISSMRDEGGRRTRSFVIYWSLRFDVTEIPDETGRRGEGRPVTMTAALRHSAP